MKNINKLNIDFMRHRHVAVAISAALVLLSLVEIFFLARLNLGIDFAGGTQLIVRFQQPTEIDEVRGLLAQAGLGEVQIQRYGEEGRNEILIKTPLVAEQQEGSRDLVEQALEGRYGKGDGRPDLNQIGAPTLTDAALRRRSRPPGRLRRDRRPRLLPRDRRPRHGGAARSRPDRQARGVDRGRGCLGRSADGAARPHHGGRLLDRERRERRPARSAASCAPAACSRWCSRCSA